MAILPAGEEREAIRLGRVGRSRTLRLSWPWNGRSRSPWPEIDAIVTAPLNKEALNLAGHHYAGHTDMLAELTGTKSSVMLLAHGDIRVGHVTTHVALADVPRPDHARAAAPHHRADARGGAATSASPSRESPSPHSTRTRAKADCSAARTTRSPPRRRRCRTDGIDVTGPVPGDTVFVKLRARQFDAVVAMYHDQGHIPVKLLGFDVDPPPEDGGRCPA